MREICIAMIALAAFLASMAARHSSQEINKEALGALAALIIAYGFKTMADFAHQDKQAKIYEALEAEPPAVAKEKP